MKDKKNFRLLADPLLEGKYPSKSLHQALAVATMCLQRDAEDRPQMADVVTALQHLARPRRHSIRLSISSKKNIRKLSMSSKKHSLNSVSSARRRGSTVAERYGSVKEKE